MSVMIAEVLASAADKLAAVSDTPLLDAEILLAHTLGKSRAYLRAIADEPLTSDCFEKFAVLMARRLQGEPIAYILGRKEFWSLSLKVNAGTLIPRADTEILVEAALTLFPDKHSFLKVADLGTGSGAIALALASERPSWEIYAVDISEIALQAARENAQELGLNRIAFFQGNWFTALPVSGFDLIVSNPPYIAEQEWEQYAEGLLYEPRTALLSGEDGLNDIRAIVKQASHYIKTGGYLMLEHGYQQGAAVRELCQLAGANHVRTITDISGCERVTIGQF